MPILTTAAALIALVAGQAASACEIALPSCVTPSTGMESTYHSEAGESVVTSAWVPNGDNDVQRVTLTHCPSGQSLTYVERDRFFANDLVTLFNAAVRDEAPHTLSDIRRDARAIGYDPRFRPAPADFCGCQPPQNPGYGCGSSFDPVIGTD